MIHKTDDNNFVISSQHVWMPGVYDSKRAANYAFRFKDEDLQELQDKNGIITFEILKQFKEDME